MHKIGDFLGWSGRGMLVCSYSEILWACFFFGLFRNRNSWNKPNNCLFSGYSDQSGCKTFIVTLLTGSDMSVINSGLKKILDYRPPKRTPNCPHPPPHHTILRNNMLILLCSLCKYINLFCKINISRDT